MNDAMLRNLSPSELETHLYMTQPGSVAHHLAAQQEQATIDLEGQIENLESELARKDDQVDHLDKQIEALEKENDELQGKLDDSLEDVTHLKDRLAELEGDK